ncbi:glycerophosphodiester phosphodiesterase family protein, partial [Methanothrix soehngenii]
MISPAITEEKLVIAHRGASGYLPEHTLEAYALAYGMGADYVEPDLVLTKDGVFICLHDIHLESTTNVEEVFPDRAREDGRWYAADFTLSEIKQLKVHERT